MVLAHKVGKLLLQDAPRNVALINVLVDNGASVGLSLFLSQLDRTFVPVEAIEVDELLLDQVAFALVVAVAATAHHGHRTLLEIGQNLLVVRKHFNRVWQDLWQLQIADVASILGAVHLPFVLVLLKFPKRLQ